MVAAITYPLGWILALQDELHVVADADIDWKTLVIVFSSGVYLLETYLTYVFLRAFSYPSNIRLNPV